MSSEYDRLQTNASTQEMTTGTAARDMDWNSDNWSRDELLGAYEWSVWTFIALIGLAVVGFIGWLGYVLL